jgi:aspartate aminotransferase
MKFVCQLKPDVHLNPNVRGLPVSATVAINEKSNRLIAGNRKIYKLGLGQSPFPVPDCVVKTLQENASQKDYLPVRGLYELRKAVSDHHRRTFNIECGPDNVLVGPGSKELMFILQLVYYGDLVIPTPAWVSYAPQAKIIGEKIYSLKTQREQRYQITPAMLDELCRKDPSRPRLIVLNYPSNPTGLTYDREELQEMAEVACRYKVVILSDEIYGKLNHKGNHESIVPFYPEGTVFSSGLSKWCGAGGWRLGFFIIPASMRWLLDAMASVASETFTSTSAPIQYAAVAAFHEDEKLNVYLRTCRKILQALGLSLYYRLRDGGVLLEEPEGAFYLFPDFSPFASKLKARGITDSPSLCERILEEIGVAIIPGYEFGREKSELTARLAYVNFNGERALNAALDIAEQDPVTEDFLRSYCSDTMDAVDFLIEWLHG